MIRKVPRAVAFSALLILVTFATFWPVLHSQFVSFDDGLYVTQNPHVIGGLTWANVRWAFSTGFFGNWHPLTWISHMLDVQLFGLRPGWHHLTNLILHTGNAVLLYLILARLTQMTWRSACVAALFALHPLHVESVAWISERKDVLSGFFFMLTLLTYARRAEGEVPSPKSQVPSPATGVLSPETVSTYHASRFTQRPWLWYGLALAFFALGLMSKPMLVTLPFVLLLLDYWPLGRFDAETGHSAAKTLGRLLLEKAPFIALSAAASVVAYLVQEKAHALSLALPLSARLANAVASYVKYLAKTFWPENLVVYYPHPDLAFPHSTQWPGWALALATVGLGAISLVAVLRRKRLPWLTTGWFWFMGMLVPVIGLVQAGTHGMADRYTYLPLIGVFICLVWGGAELSADSELGRQALPIAAGLGLSACAVVATHQAGYWHDTGTLFRHALDVNPDNAPAQFKLGALEGGQGNFESALEHFRAAIRADPKYVSAYYSLGMTLEGLGKPDEAVAAYRAAVRISPWWDAAHNRLGMALASLGHYAEACQEYAEALRLNPKSADAQFNFGAALLKLDRPNEAVEHFTQAVRLSPGDPDALSGQARALETSGKPAEAIAAYEHALKLNPDSHAALRGLAWLRATGAQPELRSGAEAVRLALRACQLTNHKDARALASLDTAYAEASRFPEAIAAAQQTREVALDSRQPDLARAAEARLELYRKDQPFHEAPAPARSQPEAQKGLSQ